MKRSFLTVLLSLMLSASLLLSGCGSDPAGDDSSDTTPADSVSDSAPDSVSDSDTEPEDTSPAVPELIPVTEKANTNLIASRIARDPITVEIQDGVTIDLCYEGWPSLCRGDGDTLYAVTSVRIAHVDPFGAVGFCKSEDGGKTWSDMEIIMDTPLDDRDSSVTYLGNGHIIVTWFTHNGSRYLEGGDLSDWRSKVTAEQRDALDKKYASLSVDELTGGSYVIHSTDGGKTWGNMVQVPINAPHGPSLMQDGKTLMFLGIPWFSNDVLGFTLSSGSLPIFRSEDGGYTWNYHSTIVLPADSVGFSSESVIIQLKDGSYLAAYRNDYNNKMSLYVSRSANGKQWSTPEKMDGINGGPPHLLELENGAVLMTYGYRVSPKCGIRAMLSYDGGKTWGEEFVISTSERNASGDLGYPTSVQMDDGSIITLYYDTKKGDNYCSILYTKWHLEEADD